MSKRTQPKPRVESVVHKGIVFRRYPDSPRRTDRVYFTPSGTQRARGVKRLHQEIWEDNYGPIPPGHHIHHRDNNPLNNDLANLECVPHSKHRSDHRKQEMGALDPAVIAARLDRIRPLSKAWHQTPEGKRHHEKLAPSAKVKDLYLHPCGKTLIVSSTAKPQPTVRQLSASGGWIMRHASAWCAARLLRRADITKQKRARLRVPTNSVVFVKSEPAGNCPVYNLSVEEAHEYYANGILVHNCHSENYCWAAAQAADTPKLGVAIGRGARGW